MIEIAYGFVGGRDQAVNLGDDGPPDRSLGAILLDRFAVLFAQGTQLLIFGIDGLYDALGAEVMAAQRALGPLAEQLPRKFGTASGAPDVLGLAVRSAAPCPPSRGWTPRCSSSAHEAIPSYATACPRNGNGPRRDVGMAVGVIVEVLLGVFEVGEDIPAGIPDHFVREDLGMNPPCSYGSQFSRQNSFTSSHTSLRSTSRS